MRSANPLEAMGMVWFALGPQVPLRQKSRAKCATPWFVLQEFVQSLLHAAPPERLHANACSLFEDLNARNWKLRSWASRNNYAGTKAWNCWVSPQLHQFHFPFGL